MTATWKKNNNNNSQGLRYLNRRAHLSFQNGRSKNEGSEERENVSKKERKPVSLISSILGCLIFFFKSYSFLFFCFLLSMIVVRRSRVFIRIMTWRERERDGKNEPSREENNKNKTMFRRRGNKWCAEMGRAREPASTEGRPRALCFAYTGETGVVKAPTYTIIRARRTNGKCVKNGPIASSVVPTTTTVHLGNVLQEERRKSR